ncbi:MAG: transcriptional repressor [Nitrospirota bacterium]|nr:MAG: transcriptional repressor [Nitrospirota bacterium]
MARSAKELDLLKQHLSKHNLKLTRQREHILNAFLKMEHVTAEQMYHLLAKKDPHIGLATIYRTLKLFCETGLAQERHFGTQTQFDNVAQKGHHDHMICTSCGKIVEFQNCQIEKLQEEVATKNGFSIQTHKLELYGLCGNCRV